MTATISANASVRYFHSFGTWHTPHTGGDYSRNATNPILHYPVTGTSQDGSFIAFGENSRSQLKDPL